MSDSAQVRARAAQILTQVTMQGRSLDALLANERSATAQQRGLLRTLAYDSVRWYLRLDALLERLRGPPAGKLSPEIRALAIVGLCQLLYTDIPPHAAVTETVDATRVLKQPRAAGLINALLRRCQREASQLLADVDRDLAQRTAHPRWLVEALRRDWGDAHETILDANNQRPPFWLRVNRQRNSGTQYRARLDACGLAVSHTQFADEALLLDRAVDVRELPGFADGCVSVQDAAAQLAAHLLAAKPGERVLDACAAPGGKTCHILELTPELAELVAVDVSPERVVRIEENLQRLGLAAVVRTGDVAEPGAWWDGRPFERILLDVPCSATGVIRRHPDIKLLRREADIAALAARQSQLLQSAWQLLAPGGRLVYSSCSALSAENSVVIEAFLARESAAADVTNTALSASGIFASSDMVSFRGHRIAAGTAGMDGFYYAVLRRNEG
jgi:16S rRNA (cytosine967-C5)-methyltransferase